MTEKIGEHIIFDVLIERDINILLLEELRLSTEFQSWIVNKLSNGKKKIARFLNATHLAQYGELGSVDILFLFEDENNCRCAFLIENKLDRPQEKVKAERFFEYGEKGRFDKAWDEYMTCLVAPADYFSELNENEYFSGYVSYEDLVQWFAYAQTADPSLPPHRAAYKEQLMSFALHQWQNIMLGLAHNRKSAFTAHPIAPPNAKKHTIQTTDAIGTPPPTTPAFNVPQQPILAPQPQTVVAPVYAPSQPQAPLTPAPAVYPAQQAPVQSNPYAYQTPEQSVSALMNVDDLSKNPTFAPQMQPMSSNFQTPSTAPVTQQPLYPATDSYAADPYHADMRHAAGYAQQAAQTALFDTSMVASNTPYDQPYAQHQTQSYEAFTPDYPANNENAFDEEITEDTENAEASSKDFSDFKLYPGGILNLPKDYREEDDSVMKVFAKQYGDFSMKDFSHLKMQPLSPAAEEQCIIEFMPAEFAKDIKILHHLTSGFVDLTFLQTPMASLEALYKSIMDADMSFKETQGAAIIRIGMPAIDPQRGLESQKDLADFALKKAQKLYLLYLQATGSSANTPKERTKSSVKSTTRNSRGSSSKKSRREHPATTPDDLIL